MFSSGAQYGKVKEGQQCRGEPLTEDHVLGCWAATLWPWPWCPSLGVVLGAMGDGRTPQPKDGHDQEGPGAKLNSHSSQQLLHFQFLDYRSWDFSAFKTVS